MQQDRVRRQNHRENCHLDWNHAPQISLAKIEERLREIGVVLRAVGDPLRNSTKHGERTQSDDQGRKIEARYDQRVQSAARES